jgi:hypothetical protein
VFQVGAFRIAGPTDTVTGSGTIIRLHPRPSRFTADGSMRPFVPYGYGEAPEHEHFLAQIGPHLKNKKVVDVGAGAGILTLAAALHGASVTAYESDPFARETLQAHLQLNGLTNVTVRGDVIDDWDGKVADFATANLGDLIPHVTLATETWVTDHKEDGKHGAVRLDRAKGGRASIKKYVRPTPPTYPKKVDDAHAHLLGVKKKRVAQKEWNDWTRVVNSIRQSGRNVLAQFPDEEEAVAFLIARGNQSKLDLHEWLRDVGSKTATEWWKVTVNEIGCACGCVHEHWFPDGHHDGTHNEAKVIRHHEMHEQCAHHKMTSGDNGQHAWQRYHEEDEVIGDTQRYDPSTRALRSGGTLTVVSSPDAHGRSQVVHGSPKWLVRESL